MIYVDYRYLTEDEDDRMIFGSNSQNGRIVYNAEDSSVDIDEIEYPIEKTWDELTEEQQEQAIELEASHDDWSLWNDSMADDFNYYIRDVLNPEYDFDFSGSDFPFDGRYGRPTPEYSLSMFDTEIDVNLPWDKAFDERWISVEIEFDGRYSHDAEANYDIREVINGLTEQLADYEFEPDDPSKDEVEDMIDIVTAELSRKCREYINRVTEYLKKIEEFQQQWCDGPDEDYYRGYLECNDYKFLVDEDGNVESIEY